ncbi:MAG: hypothetical protein ACR2FH_08485 [Caulobacteraceae bacterium]
MKPPELFYWHVWTDREGVSRQTRRRIEPFDLSAIAQGAAPQWQHKENTAVAAVNLSVLPVGWQADWHENPKPQWIVPLSGRWFVETMDGQRVEMGAGDLSLGEDQGTRADDRGRKGHLSGVVGDEAVALMIVQLALPRRP